MEDAVETAFLRVQGQLNATQTILAHLINSSPDALRAAKEAVKSIEATANALREHADERMQVVSIGMIECLETIAEHLDT